MRFREIITEGRDAPLYLGFKDSHWAVQALSQNRLAAKSTQRFWDDGKRRKDNDPEYENSYWMKGISLTRDLRFAMSWGDVTFRLNQNWLSKRYKIIPFNWGYSIPGEIKNHKREREEFLVVKSTKDRYLNSEEEGGGRDVHRFVGVEGYVGPLSQFLDGIYVHISIASSPNSKSLRDHPKFLGYFDYDQKLFPADTDPSVLTDAYQAWHDSWRKNRIYGKSPK